MKNVVLTFHKEVNYGAIFQTLALQTILKKFGDAAVLDFDMKNKNNSLSLRSFVYKLAEKKKAQVLQSFLKKNVRFTPKVKNVSDIQRVCKDCNNIIVGSDQVWAKDIVKDYFDIYTLNFELNSNTNKISYAASIGKENIDSNAIDSLTKSLSNYKSISVREENAKKMLEKHGVRHVEVTLDPTLLLKAEEWDKYSIENNKYSNYIFVYMLEINESIINSVKELRDKTNMKIICLNNKNHFGENTVCLPFCSPGMFLSLVKNANYVITNSFHGTCFSIVYNKRFGVHLHTTKSVRQRELLDKLGLNCAIINNDISKIIDTNYNYEKVNDKLDELRNKSISFIEKSLGDSNE